MTAGTGPPERLAADPIIGRACVPQYYAGTVQVIDENNGAIIKTIVSTSLTDPSYDGPGTGSLAVDLVKRTLYVVNENVATISVIDPLKGFVVQTITIPDASDELSGIALDPIRGRAYVTNYNNNSISVISTGKGAACQDLQNFPLLPLLCKTSLYNLRPAGDRPF